MWKLTVPAGNSGALRDELRSMNLPDIEPKDWAVDVAHDILLWMGKHDRMAALHFGLRQYSMADVIRESVEKHAPMGRPLRDE